MNINTAIISTTILARGKHEIYMIIAVGLH